MPDLATQLLSNFVKAAQEGTIESSPIKHQDTAEWDSKKYTLMYNNQFYTFVVHRKKKVEKQDNDLYICFRQEHEWQLYLKSSQGNVNRFECEITGKPTLRILGNDEHFDSQPKPNPIAIAKLQQNLVSLVEALEGKKPLQEAIQ
jgi:hypothetical protein